MLQFKRSTTRFRPEPARRIRGNGAAPVRQDAPVGPHRCPAHVETRRLPPFVREHRWAGGRLVASINGGKSANWSHTRTREPRGPRRSITPYLRACSGVALAEWNKQGTSRRYALRLDDLRPWHLIVATCAACGNRAHVAAALLRHRRPPYTKLVLERRLSYDEVTEIFVRVNSLGAKLRSSALALAQITAKGRNSLKTFQTAFSERKVVWDAASRRRHL